MAQSEAEVAVLLADVTGSTPLYETIGDAEAARRVGRCLQMMREIIAATGGVFVSSKGDDVLSTFAEPADALACAEAILARMPVDGLSVHAGLHSGSVIASGGNLFGDAVNLTARLAAMANAGEVLISRDFAVRLPRAQTAQLRHLSSILFKGKAIPVDVYALTDATPAMTEMQILPARRASDERDGMTERVVVALTSGGERHIVEEGRSVSIGRAPDSDLVIDKPWVSRQHATVTVARGRVQLTDRSSYGCYVADALGCEFAALRETVVLTGSGRISLGSSASSPDAAIIGYEVRPAPSADET